VQAEVTDRAQARADEQAPDVGYHDAPCRSGMRGQPVSHHRERAIRRDEIRVERILPRRG
jgi:hypothetical protein